MLLGARLLRHSYNVLRGTGIIMKAQPCRKSRLHRIPVPWSRAPIAL